MLVVVGFLLDVDDEEGHANVAVKSPSVFWMNCNNRYQ